MRKLFIMSIFILCLAIPSFVHASTSTALYINNKLVSDAVSPFIKDGVTYVPLNEITQKMGDTITVDKVNLRVDITDKNKAEVTVYANETYAIVSGKASPLKTKVVNGQIIDVKAPAIFKNNQMYVPIEFIEAEYGLTYNVETVKTEKQTNLYIGVLPKSLQKTVDKRTFSLKVNNKAISSKYSPFVLNGVTYVPLTEIAKKMGGDPYSTKTETMVDFGSIYYATVKTGSTYATIKDIQTISRDNTWTVPIGQKIKKGVKVDVKAKSVYKNGQLYVPIDFIGSDIGLNYYVQTVKDAEKTTIYVGELPTELATPIKKNGYALNWALVVKAPGDYTNVTAVVKDQQVYVARAQGNWYKIKVGTQSGFVHKDDIKLGKSLATGKMYSDGWFAPVLKSNLSKNPLTNKKILEKELGFKDGISYSIFGGRAIEAFYTNSEGDLQINVYQWENKTLNQSYRIPIVAKEVFKLFFGKDATRVYNYFQKNDIPEKFTANGKTVTAGYDNGTGILYLNVHH